MNGMAHRQRSSFFTATLLACSFVVGCSPINEMNRPDPVDVSKFIAGEKRVDVIAELGLPTATIPDQDKSCDMYQLYTRGPNAAGKAGIAFFEGAADVATLGLAEVVFTPIEAGTSSAKHTVLMCYDGNGQLADIRVSGENVNSGAGIK